MAKGKHVKKSGQGSTKTSLPTAKLQSNAFSTGGGGNHFEEHVQASFVTLMLTGGCAPCLPCWPIQEIKLQGKIDGYETDDLIVYVENPDSRERRKLLGQVKHRVQFTKNNSTLEEVLNAAWLDFNNPKLFTKTKDVIALITGPLNEVDSKNVLWLLNQARTAKDADDFYRDVAQIRFSPAESEKKLTAIKTLLKKANNNQEVPKDEVFNFLRHFHVLGYDVDKETGVVLSLLHSHISQFKKYPPSIVWRNIVAAVQPFNQTAGTITLGNLPSDLLECFVKPAQAIQIPSHFVSAQPQQGKILSFANNHAQSLSLLNLVGKWNEKNPTDFLSLQKILKQDEPTTRNLIHELFHLDSQPLEHRNGVWLISDRRMLLEALSERMFDSDIDEFKNLAINVLSEIRPDLEFTSIERYQSKFGGVPQPYSDEMRAGIAETMAMLKNNSTIFKNCSANKINTSIDQIVRQLICDAPWDRWASLSEVLPLIAEATPELFISLVAKEIKKNPKQFELLFAQENSDLSGRNYIFGLLWALETLAWSEEHLVSTCLTIAELTAKDPGGNWTNRPTNSLCSILLPWLPQTKGTPEKRLIAIKTVCKELPEVGWNLLIDLFPNRRQASSYTRKPIWFMKVEDSQDTTIDAKTYWSQIEKIAEFALTEAGTNITKISELIQNAGSLPPEVLDKLIERIQALSSRDLDDEERLSLWNTLVTLVAKHRRFEAAEWAFNKITLEKIEAIANEVAPTDPFVLHANLFTNRDLDHVDSHQTWEETRDKFNKKRLDATLEIFNLQGISGVLKFTQTIAHPYQLGQALAKIDEASFEDEFLDKNLASDDSKIRMLIAGYISEKNQRLGWTWSDGIDKESWSDEMHANFYMAHPFDEETWKRVSSTLKQEDLYWSAVVAHPSDLKVNLNHAIEKLITVKRTNAAIECLNRQLHSDAPINTALAISALSSVTSSTHNTIDIHHITELIKHLQSLGEVATDMLIAIEWKFLPLLNRFSSASPKTLYQRLAIDPEFFVELIQCLYRSTKKTMKKLTSDVDHEKAERIWQLLNDWQTPPGAMTDGNFNSTHFLNWIKTVEALTKKSGHFESAMIKVGNVLIHCSADKDGFWINKSVAAVLNSPDAEQLQKGFRLGIINSRGAHWIDPTGAPELTLSESFKTKASQTEDQGFIRLASLLRTIANDYQAEARLIQQEHQ